MSEAEKREALKKLARRSPYLRALAPRRSNGSGPVVVVVVVNRVPTSGEGAARD